MWLKALTALVLLEAPLATQGTTLTGTFKDAKDAVINGVSLTITNKETGVARSTKSESAVSPELDVPQSIVAVGSDKIAFGPVQ